MSLPDEIQRSDILFAFDAIDNSLEHSFADSTVYDVLHDGRRYPPKAVVGLAAEVRFGRPTPDIMASRCSAPP
jgi:5-methylcytosine-specific restriction enzyme A